MLKNGIVVISKLDKLMTITVSFYTCWGEIGILEMDMINSHN